MGPTVAAAGDGRLAAGRLSEQMSPSREAAPAPVAQWIERPPPEREVASSNLAGRVVRSGAAGEIPGQTELSSEASGRQRSGRLPTSADSDLDKRAEPWPSPRRIV